MSWEQSGAGDGDVHRLPWPDSWFGRIVDGFNAVGGVLILLVMVLVGADIVARDAFNAPIHGVSELVGASVIMIVFSQLASTLRHQRMSRADIFLDGFLMRRPRAGHVLRAAFGLAGAFVCGVLVYASWPKLAAAWQTAEFIGVEGIFTAPIWPMRLFVVAGSLLTALQYLVFVVEDLRVVAGGKPSEELR